MKKITILVAVIALVALMLPSVLAAPGGATIVNGSAETNSGTAAESINVTGGEVQEVNVSGVFITSRWAGFYGNVQGTLALRDASNNDFYNWTVSDMTGAVVYAANESVTDWGTLAAGTTSEAPAWIIAAAADNYSNTYTVNEAFVSASDTVPGTNYVQTFNSTGGQSLKTYHLAVDSTTNVWAGLAINDDLGFNGNVVDYQILAPANTETVYNFYVELP